MAFIHSLSISERGLLTQRTQLHPTALILQGNVITITSSKRSLISQFRIPTSTMSSYDDRTRPRPHVSIPDAQRTPFNPNTSGHAFPAYSVEVTPPAYTEYGEESLANPWDRSPETPRPRVHSMTDGRPLGRTASASASSTRNGYMAFPEPQIYRSTSYTPTPTLQHRHSRSELLGSSGSLRLHKDPSIISFNSIASSYNRDDDSDHYGSGSGDVRHGSRITLDTAPLMFFSTSAQP